MSGCEGGILSTIPLKNGANVNADMSYSILSGILSLVTFAIGYGMLKQEVHGLKDDIKRVEEDNKQCEVERKEFVTYKYLAAVMEPLNKQLDEIKGMISKILNRRSDYKSEDAEA